MDMNTFLSDPRRSTLAKAMKDIAIQEPVDVASAVDSQKTDPSSESSRDTSSPFILDPERVDSLTEHRIKQSLGMLEDFQAVGRKPGGAVAGFLAEREGELFMVKGVNIRDEVDAGGLVLASGLPMWLQDTMVEAIAAPLFKTYGLYDRAPIVKLVVDAKHPEMVRVSSRFVSDGMEGAELLKDVSPTCSLVGLEKVLACSMRFGDDDCHLGNLMVVQQPDGKYQVQKIDHGRAFGHKR